MEENQTMSVAKVPNASGPCIPCEWCGHTFPDSEDCNHDGYAAAKKKNAAAKKDALGSGADSAIGRGGESATVDSYMIDKCALHMAASSVLMELLYAARMATLVCCVLQLVWYLMLPNGTHTGLSNCIVWSAISGALPTTCKNVTFRSGALLFCTAWHIMMPIARDA